MAVLGDDDCVRHIVGQVVGMHQTVLLNDGFHAD